MKSLDDVKADMSELYEQVKAHETEIKMGDALANIAGKFLKAETLIVAHRALDQRLPNLPRPMSMDEFQTLPNG